MNNGVMPKLQYIDPPEYDRYEMYRDYLKQASNFSCVYCTISESESPGATFNIDHFRPKARFPKLKTKCENLRYACPRCNSYKRKRWITEDLGCISDCDSCTSKACKDNIERFIDSLVEVPSEYMYLDEDNLLYAYSTSKPADYTIKYLRLNRKQLVKLRYVRRFMDSWLDELKVKKEKAISDIEELKKRQQEITVMLEQRYNDKNHPYRNVILTMAEMLVLQAEQSLVLIEDEIQRINHILLQRRGSDEALKT